MSVRPSWDPLARAGTVCLPAPSRNVQGQPMHSARVLEGLEMVLSTEMNR